MAAAQEEAKMVGTIAEEPVDLEGSFEDILPPLSEQETLVEGVFTWQIDDWYGMTGNKYVSPRFRIGDFEWDILLFPNGNRNKGIALYIEPHPVSAGEQEEKNEKDDTTTNTNEDAVSNVQEGTAQEKEDTTPDKNWYCCAQFALILSRPGNDKETNVSNKSHHRFDAMDSDWGFSNFIDANHLRYATKNRHEPILNEGKLNLTAYVRVLKDPTGVLWHNFMNYDSKKETGYVGFKNQGATCYLNSLLQSYFFTKYFRKLVYEIPTDNESPNNSVTLALQKAFYQLQVSNDPLDTLELTRSFGWDSGDAFQQHDVQELNRILMDRLENKMKNTPVDGYLNDIFVGKMKSFIKCINVDYESSRVEDFWDLQMNVKNMKNLTESFESYTEIELMNGENQYAAQDFGLQDAEKGVIFEYLPPVLHLQLKRFEYDFNYDQLIKINDRYEFPETIDLSKFLDDGSKQDRPVVYNLHGVLVHAGDISTGHYYTMIKPNADDKWYRFDDERVWRVTKSQVFDENFGLNRLPDEQLRQMTREQYQNYLLARHTSAYMLVYIRSDREEELLQPVTKADVPQHVIDRVEKEMKERAIREKEIRDAHLYVTLVVYNVKNFINYHGLDPIPNELLKFSYQDLTNDKELPITLKIERTAKIEDVCKQIKEHINILQDAPAKYWRMGTRQNNTIRLAELMNFDNPDATLESVIKDDESVGSTLINVYVEEPYLDLRILGALKSEGIVKFQNVDDELLDDVRTNITTYLAKLGEDNEALQYEKSDDTKLIFVKLFNAYKQQLSGLGYMRINEDETIENLAKTLTRILNYENITPNQISIYEEINIGNTYPVSQKCQFYEAEIGTGDILSVEVSQDKPKEIASTGVPIYDNLLEFYNYLEHRVKLRFSKVSNSNDDYTVSDEEGDAKPDNGQSASSSSSDRFDVWVNANIKYSELAKIVGANTSINPAFLKLYAIYSNGRIPLKSKSTLNDYLMKDYNCNVIPPFQFEELSIPLKEFEHLRPIKFYWLKESYIHYQSYEFEVPDNCSVEDFLQKIQTKIGFSDDEKDKILLWTNSGFEFKGVLPRDSYFKQVSKDYLLFGRVLPEELDLFNRFEEYDSTAHSNSDSSVNVDENARVSNDNLMNATSQGIVRHHNNPEFDGHLVIVSQYFKDMENRHGISFLFNILPNEPFPQTRDRLHKKFGLGQKEFSKIKLGILFSTPQGRSFKSLQNYSDEELERLVLFDVMSNLDTIFLDHPDRLRSHNSHDRPMVIKN